MTGSHVCLPLILTKTAVFLHGFQPKVVHRCDWAVTNTTNYMTVYLEAQWKFERVRSFAVVLKFERHCKGILEKPL